MGKISINFFKYVCSALVGGLIFLGLFLIFPAKINYYETDNYKCEKNCLSSFKIGKDSLHHLITILKNDTKGSILIDEKINSLNTRINDFYIFAGILITLVLAILAGVYVKTDHSVERHLKENYTKYKDDIEAEVNEAKSLVAKIKTELELAQGLKSKNNDSNVPR